MGKRKKEGGKGLSKLGVFLWGFAVDEKKVGWLRPNQSLS